MILVRHGQNEVNIDRPVLRYADARLTPTGRAQARRLAGRWTGRPAVTATSPFRSARQTARLLQYRDRAHPPVDQRLAEFRYLDPAFADGSTREQRRDRARAYWERCDPDVRDGPTAESFTDLLVRVRAAVSQYATCPPRAPDTLLVTHGMVIAAVLCLAARPAAHPRLLMLAVRETLLTAGPVDNCAVVRVPHDFAVARWLR